MFVVLDTNHYRELTENTRAGQRLRSCLLEREADVFTCIVAVEESVRGWFALLSQKQAGNDQIVIYSRLQRELETLLKLPILAFDAEAAKAFHRFQEERVRIGTMDLKIAAICYAHDALLLTRNLVDFDKVTGLRVENWLD